MDPSRAGGGTDGGHIVQRRLRFMPAQDNGRKEPLFDLIRSLTKAEKRNFKLYATRQGDANAKFIVLFDAMEAMDVYDEQKLMKRCGITKSQIANIKAHLYRQILVSVRLIGVSHSLRMQLSEQIDFARILYDKGLHGQCLRVLDKAKKIAVESGQSTIALEIVEFEKTVETHHLARTSTRADQLSAQTTELCERIEVSNKLSNIAVQLYNLHLKLGYVRSQRDLCMVTDFFKPQIDSFSEMELSFIEQVQLAQARMWYAHILHDFPACFRYSRRIIELFDNNGHLKPLYYDYYLKAYSRYLESLFLTRNWRRLSSAIDRYEKAIEDIVTINTNASILSYLALYLHRVNLYLMEGSFTSGISIVADVERYISSAGSYLDTHYKMLLYYKIACLYFGAADYRKCIYYLERIISVRDQSIRRDLQCFARMLNLIASYEAGLDYNLDYQIRNVYTFIIKMNDMHGVQKVLISFLKRLNHIYAGDFKQELRNLYDRIKPYESHPYERRTFFYLDIISWLESKLEDRSVEEIVSAKFRKGLRDL
ncbi:MAG: hypothetical protein OSJ22_07735 [Rikenellaceae bacterium]|nr:hypothetical protein [Rikenellaceae bacterium]